MVLLRRRILQNGRFAKSADLWLLFTLSSIDSREWKASFQNWNWFDNVDLRSHMYSRLLKQRAHNELVVSESSQLKIVHYGHVTALIASNV